MHLRVLGGEWVRKTGRLINYTQSSRPDANARGFELCFRFEVIFAAGAELGFHVCVYVCVFVLSVREQGSGCRVKGGARGARN